MDQPARGAGFLIVPCEAQASFQQESELGGENSRQRREAKRDGLRG